MDDGERTEIADREIQKIYIKKKGPELNVSKSEVMLFKKAGGRRYQLEFL